MLSKISLIAIFVAVCIDTSFEQATVFECACDEDCLEIVYNQGLYNGIIPIVVTNNILDPKTVNKVVQIKNFFESKDPGIKMIQVYYPYGGPSRQTATLVYYSPKAMEYPFVGIMKDNRMLRKVVVGFNEQELNTLFGLAQNTHLLGNNNNYFHKSKGFIYDLYQKMKNWKRNKKIDPKVIEAAENPDVFPVAQSNASKPVLDRGTSVTQSDSRQPALASGISISATQSDSRQPAALNSDTGKSSGSQPNPNTPKNNYPPTYDKSLSWPNDFVPGPEAYIYNYPTTPTFDANTMWALPPTEYPQQNYNPSGPPTTGSSTNSELAPTGNNRKRKNYD